MFDLSIFALPETWITLVTLIFLEIVLGVDNIVFISLTSDRLPREKQHLGRKLGLAGALLTRCLFLAFASYLAHMTNALFVLRVGAIEFPVSVHTIIMLAGGAYLIYKGISELVDLLKLKELKAEVEQGEKRPTIGLARAVGTIMVMDIVFSIDSVITAVGLAEYLIVMILAVIVAVLIMMLFIDPIADFINRNVEMTILALVFISVIGILLVLEGLDFHSGIMMLGMDAEKIMVYFAMAFSVLLELIQMRFRKNRDTYLREHAGDED